MGGSKDHFLKMSGNSFNFEKWLCCHIFGVGLPGSQHPLLSPMSHPGSRSDLRRQSYARFLKICRVARSPKKFKGFIGSPKGCFFENLTFFKNGGVASFQSGVARSGCGVASFSPSPPESNEPSRGSIRPAVPKLQWIF